MKWAEELQASYSKSCCKKNIRLVQCVDSFFYVHVIVDGRSDSSPVDTSCSLAPIIKPVIILTS